MGKRGDATSVFFLNTVYSHDDRAEFGTSPQNPILLPSVPMEYAYLDSLYFDDGEDVVYSRTATCSSDNGHTMDQYAIRRQGSDEVVCSLFFDGYAANATPNVPKGFYLKMGDKIIRHKDQCATRAKDATSAHHATDAQDGGGKGCLVPFVVITSTLFAVGTAIARTIFY